MVVVSIIDVVDVPHHRHDSDGLDGPRSVDDYVLFGRIFHGFTFGGGGVVLLFDGHRKTSATVVNTETDQSISFKPINVVTTTQDKINTLNSKIVFRGSVVFLSIWM